MVDTPHGILGVIGSDPAESGAVLRRACELAEDSGASLTIAALSAPRWHLAWLAGLACSAACTPPVSLELARAARDRLARAAEFAPLGVELETLVVEGPPRRPLQRLLASGRYDLVVVGAHLASRRSLARLPIPALVVPARDTVETPRGAGDPSPLLTG